MAVQQEVCGLTLHGAVAIPTIWKTGEYAVMNIHPGYGVSMSICTLNESIRIAQEKGLTQEHKERIKRLKARVKTGIDDNFGSSMSRYDDWAKMNLQGIKTFDDPEEADRYYAWLADQGDYNFIKKERD